MTQLTRYVDAVKFAPDLRNEIVLSGTRWSHINNQHLEFSPDVKGSNGHFVSCLVREGCIVQIKNWPAYVESTGEKLLKALKHACSPDTLYQ